ncbi:MAG: 4'-phosphopantetheinyl transferase superfamily protein [Mycoplasmatales bacterium]|nr:4'-phosphopantetheinyl transferase superfamily protein [Mycoplasmatales bacterium]
MIGIDITTISRFKNKNKQFVEKILHSNEIVEYEKSSNKSKFLATRWAIKEAIYKADNKNHAFHNINIIKTDNIYKFKNFIISTSSEKDILIAIVKKGEIKNEY